MDIPDGVTTIGIGVFASCTGLISINVSNDNPFYKSEGNCLLNKDGANLISGCKGSIIPDGITMMGCQDSEVGNVSIELNHLSIQSREEQNVVDEF